MCTFKKSPPKQLKLRSKPWIDSHIPGFSLSRIRIGWEGGGGEFVPPYGETSAMGQSITGGTHEGDIDLMGDLILIDYIIN